MLLLRFISTLRALLPVKNTSLVVVASSLAVVMLEVLAGPLFLPRISLMICFCLLIVFALICMLSLYQKLSKDKNFHEQYIEELRTAKEQAEVEALKLQLDPHFLFNTLGTLQHLIDPGNDEARNYVQSLSDVYRYILRNRSKELVPLADELQFSRQYIHLLSARYGKAVQFRLDVSAADADDHLIIPVSLQILIENAIKHNQFSPEVPLELSAVIQEKSLLVENRIRSVVSTDSSRVGLTNLSERCLIIVGRPLQIFSSPEVFSVCLPLIRYR